MIPEETSLREGLRSRRGRMVGVGERMIWRVFCLWFWGGMKRMKSAEGVTFVVELDF